jgi:hypothetical protein
MEILVLLGFAAVFVLPLYLLNRRDAASADFDSAMSSDSRLQTELMRARDHHEHGPA